MECLSLHAFMACSPRDRENFTFYALSKHEGLALLAGWFVQTPLPLSPILHVLTCPTAINFCLKLQTTSCSGTGGRV
jgi:hypothetical protein